MFELCVCIRLFLSFLFKIKTEYSLLIHVGKILILQRDGVPRFTVFIYWISKQNWKLTPDRQSQHNAIEFRTEKRNTQLNVWINWFHSNSHSLTRVAVRLFNGNNYSVGIITPRLNATKFEPRLLDESTTIVNV